MVHDWPDETTILRRCWHGQCTWDWIAVFLSKIWRPYLVGTSTVSLEKQMYTRNSEVHYAIWMPFYLDIFHVLLLFSIFSLHIASKRLEHPHMSLYICPFLGEGMNTWQWLGLFANIRRKGVGLHFSWWQKRLVVPVLSEEVQSHAFVNEGLVDFASVKLAGLQSDLESCWDYG